MDPKIEKEFTLKNAAIVGGTILTVFFWKEVLVLGAVIAIGLLLWKNREKIKKFLNDTGKGT